ncbi:hypothetical protein AARAC_008286, partial [Aspergillus arachidicola]
RGGSLVLQVDNAHGQNEADSTPVWRASSRGTTTVRTQRYCRQVLQQAQMRQTIGDEPCIRCP